MTAIIYALFLVQSTYNQKNIFEYRKKIGIGTNRKHCQHFKIPAILQGFHIFPIQSAPTLSQTEPSEHNEGHSTSNL